MSTLPSRTDDAAAGSPRGGRAARRPRRSSGWAVSEFGDRLCLTCSWQKQSSVLVHMVAELGVEIDIVELDTHLFFRESYETRERLVERYGIRLIRPEIMTIAEQHASAGAEPLGAGAGPLLPHPQGRAAHPRVATRTRRGSPASAATSRPHERASARSSTRTATVSGRFTLSRAGRRRTSGIHHEERHPVQPAPRRRVPLDRVHPVYAPDQPDEEERAGRWAGSDKLECGIHATTERNA